MGAVAWSMTAILRLIGALLYSCAHADDAPDWAVRVMAETHKRVIVEHQNWYARDFRYVSAGQEVWGNCATFATTAAVLAMQAGHTAQVVQDGPGARCCGGG
jgi:hypothetical protein